MSDIVERLPLPPLPKLTARLTVSDECDLYDWLQKHRETAVETATKNLHVALADTAEILSRYAERVDALRAQRDELLKLLVEVADSDLDDYFGEDMFARISAAIEAARKP